MKKLILFVISFLSLNISSQTYPSQNINLLALISPNTATTGVGPDGRRYSAIWGWKQPGTGKEYAIAGSSIGTYFIDVSSPATPSVSAFVPGRPGCTWREIKTYQNYCYVVSDDATPNTFQIMDMSTLPGTVTLVHNGTTYFERGHSIWIDQDKMYISSTTYSNNGYSSMNVYSLATPSVPVFLRSLNSDVPSITTVHDMYSRNDTVFASCGYQGLYVLKFNSTLNTFTQLGNYTGYTSTAYNHSSMLTQDGKYLLFCDEVPAAQPIKLVNVQNLANIQPVQTWIPHPGTTPHNPFLIGNKWAIVSCYQDGLYIYDISQPGNVAQSGFFDTYPQGGFNTNSYAGSDYRGNWGAYPYLPSGIIVASDMQNGIFILDPTAAYNNPVGIKSNTSESSDLIFYPNPANEKIAIHYNSSSASVVQLRNLTGQLLFEKKYSQGFRDYLDVKDLPNGTYIITVLNNEQKIIKKIIVNH